MYTREQISLLAEKWLNGTISETEKQVFESWYNRRKPDEIHWLGYDTEEVVRQKIFESVQAQMAELNNVVSPTPVNSRLKLFKGLSIAASFLLVVSLFFFHQSKPGKNLAQELPVSESPSLPAPPATVKATITLADGTEMDLDRLLSGDSIVQGTGGFQRKPGGELIYIQHAVSTQNLFNKIMVPRGSQVLSVVLSDGTKVWLNVESSLRYPVTFNGTERKVTLTGEAYFEVNKRKEKFIVETPGAYTEVLGTHFNINSYKPNDEQITLLEGSVKVRNNITASGELKPGEQVVVAQQGIQLKHSPDLEAVMAWKNGLFKLSNANIYSIMQQLAQWYDVDVVFKGTLQEKRFSGMISRNTQLHVVLEMLAMTKEVKFVTEGKTIVVYPY